MAIMTTRELPKHVRVGAVEYAVIEVEDLHTHRDGVRVDLQGQVDYEACEIHIRPGYTVQQQLFTLWHEMIHAMLEQAGFVEHDERMIVTLGYAVVGAIRANPQLMEMAQWQL